MHTHLRVPNNLLILHQIINITCFPCSTDEIAEPCPGMNIKVAAFTVSEKSINIFAGCASKMERFSYCNRNRICYVCFRWQE